MDRDRFDSLSKAVAAGASRRQLLKLLAGGALGGIAGVARIGSGDAKPRPDGCTGSGGNCNASRPCCADSVCIDGKCCLTRKICDGARCTDLDNDPNNCGFCGNVCAAGQVCVAGVCSCTPGSCPNGCCDAARLCQASTNGTCGLGGAACDLCVASAGEACVTGICTCDQAACAAIGSCCQGGVCRASGDATCGTTGGACADCSANGQVCVSGACVTPAECPPPCPSCEKCEDGRCVPDSSRDDENCCPPGGGGCSLDGSNICRNGVCIPNCPDCTTLSGSACLPDPSQDLADCCLPGPDLCVVGTRHCCEGICVANAADCGCKGPCPGPYANATVTCRSGGCFFQCNAGYEDCNIDDSDGCKLIEPISNSSCGLNPCSRQECDDDSICVPCGGSGAGICCPPGYKCGLTADGACGGCVEDKVANPDCQVDPTTTGRFIR